MADYAIPKNGAAYIFYTGLVAQSDTKTLKSSPTLASGDFKVSIDGGALANLATLPTNTPGGVMVKISLSGAEMTGDNITVVCIDAAGAEWCDQIINIQTSTRGVADLAYPATSGRSMVVDASGLVDANTVKLGPSGSGTAQTARDIGTSVLLSSGTGTGQLSLSSGAVLLQATQTGVTIPTVTNLTNAPGAGDFTATMKTSIGTAVAASAVASVTGAVGSVTGNVGGNVTGSVGSVVGAVASVTARVTANTDQLAGQTVTAAAGVTFPTSVASPTNITAGTITTVTNLTNAATAGDFTSTMKTSIGTAVAASAVASVTGAVGSVTGNVGGNVTGSVGSVVGAVGSVTGAVGSVTGNVGGNVTGSVGSLATQAKADVNTEFVDALATDTYAEPGQGTPAATLSLSAKIGYLFKAWRNKSTQTSTAYNLFNDDAATVDQKATASDDGTTFTRGEITTGP